MIELSQKLSNGLIDSNTNDFFIKLFNSQLFVNKTVAELVHGYEDPLMTLAYVLFPGLVKTNKFSLMNGVGLFWYFMLISHQPSTWFSVPLVINQNIVVFWLTLLRPRTNP